MEAQAPVHTFPLNDLIEQADEVAILKRRLKAARARRTMLLRKLRPNLSLRQLGWLAGISNVAIHQALPPGGPPEESEAERG